MTDFLLGKYGSCDVFSNARGIPPWKPTAYRAKNICFFWCYFHHTSDPSFFNYNKKKLGIAPKFFLKKFKLKFTKTNAPQSLYKGFESHMSKFECWLVPIFLHIFFILLLILPSKKNIKMHVQTYMANKTFTQKIRENDSNFWKRACPYMKMPQI